MKVEGVQDAMMVKAGVLDISYLDARILGLGLSDLPALYRSATADAALLCAIRSAAPEYGRDEFLLPVAVDGEPVLPNAAILAELRELRRTTAVQPVLTDTDPNAADRGHEDVGHHEDVGVWFREGTWDGAPVVLVARWLCHLTGIRHRTVQLFIDHPAAAGVTLVQVRSLAKVEAPGDFDMPVAGHVVGTDTVEAALCHELAEELGLGLDDLVELRSIGSYEAVAPGRGAGLWRNREWRVVYRSRLRPDALARVRFADGEVAALAIFAVDELCALARLYPERLASGLGKSLPLYELAGGRARPPTCAVS